MFTGTRSGRATGILQGSLTFLIALTPVVPAKVTFADERPRARIKVVRKTLGSQVVNGSFEAGRDSSANHWQTAAGSPPVRSKVDAHNGSFSMQLVLVNEGAKPREGILTQTLHSILGGRNYQFEFWVRLVKAGPGYIQQYQIQWLDPRGHILADTGLTGFRGLEKNWRRVSVPELVAPPNASKARIRFRFVTGAIADSMGSVFLDDVALSPRKTKDTASDDPARPNQAPKPDRGEDARREY